MNQTRALPAKKGTRGVRIVFSQPNVRKFLNQPASGTGKPRVSSPTIPPPPPRNRPAVHPVLSPQHPARAKTQYDKYITRRVSTPQSPVGRVRVKLPSKRRSESEHKRRIIRLNILRRCHAVQLETGSKCITNIVYNNQSHIVSVFKDYLIFDDIKETLERRYRGIKECKTRLRRILTAHPMRERPAPWLPALEERVFLDRAQERKRHIRELKAADVDKAGKGGEASTILRTAFLDSLAKEDLSNSLRLLPAESLSLDHKDEESRNIESLLSALNAKEDPEPLPVSKPKLAVVSKRKDKSNPPVHKMCCQSKVSVISKNAARLLEQLRELTGARHPQKKPDTAALGETKTVVSQSRLNSILSIKQKAPSSLLASLSARTVDHRKGKSAGRVLFTKVCVAAGHGTSMDNYSSVRTSPRLLLGNMKVTKVKAENTQVHPFSMCANKYKLSLKKPVGKTDKKRDVAARYYIGL